MKLGDNRRRTAALLFLLSLALRLAALYGVAHAGVEPLYDERQYFDRALAFREILGGLARLEGPTAPQLDAAYAGGHWPPFHPLLLGAAMLVAGPSVSAARALVAIASALTTLLVYRVGRAVAGPKAARAAAGLHAVYPGFIAFSHYLWAETTYLLLLLAAIALALGPRSPSSSGWPLWRAAASGLVLGLGALTRVTAAVNLPVVALWLLVTRRCPRPRIGAAVLLAAGLAVILPWQAVLFAREGRPVVLSTLNGWNLALGNNPWVRPGYGSSWGDEEGKARLRAALDERSRERRVRWEAVAAGFAREEMARRPLAVPVRSLERLRMLWAPDFFPLRHLFRAVYPPLPPALAALVALCSVLAYFALLTLAVLGVVGPKTDRGAGQGLLVALLAAGMLPAAATVGISRLHLPLLGLLLPAAGLGLSRVRRGPGRGAALVLSAIVCLASASALPLVARSYLEPSSAYASLFAPAARSSGGPAFSDRIVARRAADGGRDLTVTLHNPGARFRSGGGELSWPASQRTLELDVDLAGEAPLVLAIVDDRRETLLSPIRRDTWGRWTPSGVEGVEILWAGGAGTPPGAR